MIDPFILSMQFKIYYKFTLTPLSTLLSRISHGFKFLDIQKKINFAQFKSFPHSFSQIVFKSHLSHLKPCIIFFDLSTTIKLI